MKGKAVYTSGECAKICKVAPRTVSKWFDSGRLRGYRIPGSQDRRIPREQLIRFLKEHGMPLGELEEEGWHKILIIGAEPLFIERTKELLPDDEDYKAGSRLEVAHSGFEAGVCTGQHLPDTVILDFALGRGECIAIARQFRQLSPDADLIALTNEDERDTMELLGLLGFDAIFVKPFDVALLAERLKEGRS